MNIKHSRRFHLDRKHDISGVSGTTNENNNIAQGIQFGTGIVVLHWLSPCASTNIYPNIEALRQVHGHEGASTICWDDPEEESGFKTETDTSTPVMEALEKPENMAKVIAAVEEVMKDQEEKKLEEQKEDKKVKKTKRTKKSAK
jgi:hypothetical protein